MNKVFNSYGKYYDIIYADKDYEKECDFLEEIFRKYSTFMPHRILDGGCGTGSHAVPLAKRGYEITGIDLSEEMINVAKEKAKRNGANIEFQTMDLRTFQLNKKFDAAICMFAVINYLTNNNDLPKTISNIRSHIKKNSLFIFDFWYGPAVLAISPTHRIKTVEKDGLKITRFADPHLNRSAHTCDVNYHFLVTKENVVLYEGNEKHQIRYYFPEEIKQCLQESSFKLIKLCPFLEPNGMPSEKTWNVTAIARAV